ncbi:MAG: polysulfide reductase NrfD [Austwickia sp.]|nr:polysulfide reductase NrfD [Austwickia sp.]
MSGPDLDGVPGAWINSPEQTVRRPRRRRADDVMVPEAAFTSYYGRPVVKPAPWKHEIPAYLFLGGLAAGSALIASGAELTGRVTLQRNARLVALAALSGSGAVLVADLGKPSRFLNMMRTVKLTSPMSVGSWILAGQGTFTSAAAACEVARFVVPEGSRVARWLPPADRVASIGAALFAPPLAAYTAVLLSDTATPTWHEAYHELPYVFVASGLAAGAGAALVTTPPAECGPVRRLAVGAIAAELFALHRMERRMGLVAEPLGQGRAGAWMRASTVASVAGAVLTEVAGRRRPAAIAGGLALLAGSVATRFGVFEAGLASARDPKYTVVPQRARANARARAAAGEPVRRPGISGL